MRRRRVFEWWLAATLLVAALPVRADAPDRLGPLVFVHGLQGRGAAVAATELGCNAIYFDLPLDAPMLLPSVRGFIAEAHDAGLSVIVGLRTLLGGQYPVSPSNSDYVSAMREWVAAVVTALRDEPGVIGWATDHDIERVISFSDADFRDYLMSVHGSLAGLNDAWGSRFVSHVEVGRVGVRERDLSQPFGVGRASVDLADYRRSVCHDLMQLWAEEIRRHDPGHLLFTGRIARYRGLTAVPYSYDVVMPFMSTDVLEPDLLTHNVQGVQIARRGGQFEVIPWLRVPLPPSQAFTRNSLVTWMAEAGMRGAVGACLDDWSRISDTSRVRQGVTDQIRVALRVVSFPDQAPTPAAAVIYSPYAGGPKKRGTPYGYLPEFGDADFATLAYQYRGGTIFGGLDYLTVDDLTRTDLDRYGVILAPLCLSLPEASADALRSYLRDGGALVADIGLGMYQAGTWSPDAGPLAPQLGLANALPVASRFGGLHVGVTHPQLPSVFKGADANGLFTTGRTLDISGARASGRSFTGAADQLKGYPFQGPSCFVSLRTGAIPLATMSVRYDDERRPHFLGLIVNEVGDGLTVFATFPMWTYWPVSDPLHGALELDLMRRRASYRLLQPGLLPSTVQVSGSPDAVHLLNRGDEAQVQVLAGAADHRAFLGCISVFSAAEVDASGRRTGRARLNVALPAGSLTHLLALPLRLRPTRGECCARVSCYSPGLISMDVGGQGATWRSRRGQSPTFEDGATTQIRFGVESGAYVIVPGSKHRVTWSQSRGESRSATSTADHRGRLDFTLSLAGGQVRIEPLSSP